MNSEDADLRDSLRDEDSRGMRLAALDSMPIDLTWTALIAYTVLYAALLWAGYALRAEPTAVTTLWPADGLIFSTLLLLRKRDWVWIVLIGIVVDVLVNWLIPGPFHLDSAIWYSVTHALDGAVGAALAQHWARDLSTQRGAVRFYLAAAVGCALSTTVGVSAYLSNHPEVSLFDEWWRWWAGTYLGIVTFAPIVFMWITHWRRPEHANEPRRWWHLAVPNAVLVAMIIWIFGAMRAESQFGTSLSFAVFPILVLIALVAPTRWTMVSSTFVVVLAAALTNRGLGPFAGAADPLAGVLSLQIFLALAATMTFMISIAADENRGLITALTFSKGRYQREARLLRGEIERRRTLEQRHAGVELRNEQLATLLRHSQEIFSIATIDGKGNFINAVGRKLVGIGPEEDLRGRSLSDFAHPRERERLAREIIPAIIKGGHWSGELDFQRISDGVETAILVDAFRIDDDDGRPLWFAAVGLDVTERKRSVEQLRELNEELASTVAARTAALKEREVMLQEIHHRVKNNLQVIASLINMQSRVMLSEPTRLALQQCRSRVETMAQIHEMLYQSKDYSRVPFAKYTRDLATRILSASGMAATDIVFDFDLEDLSLAVDKAIPCGLILNELIANCVKHAFPGASSGRIRIELRRVAEQRVLLSVGDDGIGIAAEYVPEKASSLGLQLVITLVEQLDAELEILRHPGATFRVVFPVQALA